MTDEDLKSDQPLAALISGSLRIGSRSDLNEFLTDPDSTHRVQSAPYQDLFLAVKTIGLADSQELLLLATSEQRRGFIDLDCWRKDSVHMGSFMEWLAAYIQCGPEEVLITARAVDPNLLAMFLKDQIQVHVLETDEPYPAIPLILTPDERFGIEITSDAEGGTMARLLLDSIFRVDTSLGYDLIDRVRWDNRLSLEEEAYQNKRLRLEEIGFVDYYEALGIYGKAGKVVAPRPDLTSIPEEGDEALRVSSTLPALFVSSLAPGEHLWTALRALRDGREAEMVGQQLAALANRILSVHSVTPGDLEKVKPALEELRDTLNLGLEQLTRGRVALAATVLKQNDVMGLFQTGYNVLADLRTQADTVLSRGQLRLTGAERLLLESPHAEFLDGLRRLRPLFFEGTQDPQRPSYRNFGSLADVEAARQSLEEIDVLGQFFWSMVIGPGPELHPGSLRPVNCGLDDLRFGTLFVTAVLNQVLGKAFRPKPISVRELHQALTTLAGGRGDGQALADGFRAVGECRLERLDGTDTRRDILKRFIESWCVAGLEELAPLRGEVSINPHWVRMVLLYLSEDR